MSSASFSGLTASNPAAELLFTRLPAWRASFSRWLPFLVPERMPRGSPALEQTRASPVLNDELLSSVQLLSPVRLFATPWTAALQCCSTVHLQLQSLLKLNVHHVGDAIQPSHPLSSPSPPAFNQRAWQSTPVFLPREFHRQRSLEGYSPWVHRVRQD